MQSPCGKGKKGEKSRLTACQFTTTEFETCRTFAIHSVFHEPLKTQKIPQSMGLSLAECFEIKENQGPSELLLPPLSFTLLFLLKPEGAFPEVPLYT